MIVRLFLAFALLGSASAEASWRFAFGGCNFQRFGQRHWKAIAATQPKLWVWNGDTIYADGLSPTAREREYDRLKRNRYYAPFRAAVPIVGVWDDHDFAFNDSVGDYAEKRISQELLLNFLDEEWDSPRRAQEGVYTSYEIGDKTARAKLILLDGRYFREAKGRGADVLGDKQWRWLDEELSSLNGFDAVFVVSGSQVIPDGTGADTWENYPAARVRLLDRLAAVSQPVVILSGDRHFAEISKIDWGGKLLWEVTSSGLTHHSLRANQNEFRVGKPFLERNFATVELGTNSIDVQVRGILGRIEREQRIVLLEN